MGDNDYALDTSGTFYQVLGYASNLYGVGTEVGKGHLDLMGKNSVLFNLVLCI